MKIFLIILFLALISCADSNERVGYDAGYEAGYKETCKISAPSIQENWAMKNKDYKRGYDSGFRVGAIACRNTRKGK